VRVRRDDAHGVAEEHARAAQKLFATRCGALHACLCGVREVHARLGVPDAVRDRVAEAGEQVWRDRGLQAREERLGGGRLRILLLL
jgi:hypothetical protein